MKESSALEIGEKKSFARGKESIESSAQNEDIKGGFAPGKQEVVSFAQKGDVKGSYDLCKKKRGSLVYAFCLVPEGIRVKSGGHYT